MYCGLPDVCSVGRSTRYNRDCLSCEPEACRARMTRFERDCCQKPVAPPCATDLVAGERSASARAALAEAKERPLSSRSE